MWHFLLSRVAYILPTWIVFSFTNTGISHIFICYSYGQKENNHQWSRFALIYKQRPINLGFSFRKENYLYFACSFTLCSCKGFYVSISSKFPIGVEPRLRQDCVAPYLFFPLVIYDRTSHQRLSLFFLLSIYISLTFLVFCSPWHWPFILALIFHSISHGD